MSIKCKCEHCGREYNVAEQYAGKRARCKECGQVYTIPALNSDHSPTAATPPAPARQPAAAKPDAPDALYTLSADPTPPPPPPVTPAGGRTCPKCQANWPAETVLCVKCGYNFSTGTSIASSIPAAKAAGRQYADSPSLVGALLGGAFGAAIGSGIWFVIEYFTGYSIGWIALLVGALAGWGAHIGAGQKCPQAGLIAALLGVIGIFSASYANFHVLTSTEHGRDMIRAEAPKELQGEWAQMSDQEKDEVVAFAQSEVAKMGYTKFLFVDGKQAAFMGLFGLLGLFYGYRVGSGSGKKD